MAVMIQGRYTARIEEPFVVFIIGMWLPLHNDTKAVDRRLIRMWSTGNPRNVLTI